MTNKRAYQNVTPCLLSMKKGAFCNYINVNVSLYNYDLPGVNE